MVGPNLSEIPPPLKSIQHYLKIAAVHDQRDSVVSYWCRLYALQTGLKLSTKTSEETNFLLQLMNWLEATKKDLRDNEAITNDVAAQAHLENWALKLFLYADKNDRAGNFGKNIVQSFFTAGLLYDVLTVFGELSEEAIQNRKYAKWKASYIHNCVRNGETPIPGPIQDNTEDIDPNKDINEDSDNGVNSAMKPEEEEGSPLNSEGSIADANLSDITCNKPDKGEQQPSAITSRDYVATTKVEGGIELSLKQMNKAQKYIRWAESALNYDDMPTAVSNLQKALHLLTTGHELV